MKNVTNMQELVAELVRMRDLADAAECKFIERMVGAEGRKDLWGVEKYRTFDAFLSGENICRPSRFHVGKSMLQKYGEEVCQAIGISNTVMIDRLPEENKSKAIEAVTRYKQENASIPSKQTTREMLKPMGLLTNPVPKNFRKEEFDYVAECDRLRARVAELEAENASLRAQLAKFAKGPTKAKPKQSAAIEEQA